MKILMWKYSDNSNFGLVRAYTDDKRSEQDLALVKDDCSKIWSLVDVELVGNLPINIPNTFYRSNESQPFYKENNLPHYSPICKGEIK